MQREVFFHWAQDEYDFDITARDLLDFPDLKDSANRYWPTKQSILYHPWQDKEYGTYAEVDSFASLADVEEFNNAKWMTFYKHILIPVESIKKSLTQGFDENDPYDRSQLNMVLQAAVARQARLRAVLFSVKEFRDFVHNMSEQTKDTILNQCSCN